MKIVITIGELKDIGYWEDALKLLDPPPDGEHETEVTFTESQARTLGLIPRWQFRQT